MAIHVHIHTPLLNMRTSGRARALIGAGLHDAHGRDQRERGQQVWHRPQDPGHIRSAQPPEGGGSARVRQVQGRDRARAHQGGAGLWAVVGAVACEQQRVLCPRMTQGRMRAVWRARANIVFHWAQQAGWWWGCVSCSPSPAYALLHVSVCLCVRYSNNASPCTHSASHQARHAMCTCPFTQSERK